MGKTKPKHEVWKYFHTLEQGKYKCKFCNALYTKHATRMTNHLVKCKQCPPTIKQKLKGNALSPFCKDDDYPSAEEIDGDVESLDDRSRPIETFTIATRTPHETSQGPSERRETETPISSRSNRPNCRPLSAASLSSSSSACAKFDLSRFIDSMSNPHQAELNELFGRAIYASGTPLSVTENPYWQDFFTKLRPSWRLPSRSQLSNTLLNSEVQRVETLVKVKLVNASALALQCDGWSNLRNQAIVNFIVTTPDPLFVKTLSTDTERHTGEYMAEQMKIVMNENGGGSKFLAVVTDSAAAMVKARRIIVEDDQYKHLSVYGCVAHTLNLLIGDILKLKSIVNLESECKSIVNDVNGSQVLRATFTNIQNTKKGKSVSLKLPVKTRWGSIIFCIKSLIDTKFALKAIAVDEEMESLLKPAVKRLVLDDDVFWVRAEKVFTLVNPIVKWITVLESDMPRISLVPEAFAEISLNVTNNLNTAPISKQEEKTLLDAVKCRTKMALVPLHYAANILDPKLLGKNLSFEQQIEGVEYIDHLTSINPMYSAFNVDILVDLAHFREKEDAWSKPFLWKTVDKLTAVNWWKAVCTGSKLRSLAIDLLGMPPTSAATERSFSSYSLVHTKKRNRLTVERAGKLVYVAHNLKLLSPVGPGQDGTLRSPVPEEQNLTSEDEQELNSDSEELFRVMEVSSGDEQLE